MELLDKIKQKAPKDGFIGGRIRLIVGPLGIRFYAYATPDADISMRNYREGDEIPITRIEEDKVYVRPFLHEIPVVLDYYKGIRYETI